MEERVVLEGLTELAFLVEQPWQRRHRRGVLETFRRVSSSGFVERSDEFFFRPKNLGEDLEVLSMDGADRRRWGDRLEFCRIRVDGIEDPSTKAKADSRGLSALTSRLV